MCGSVFGLSAQTLVSQLGENGKYGFVNEAGNFVIDPKYDEVHFEFYEGIACVVKGKKYVFINSSGKEISKSYGWVDYFDSNDLCLVANGGKEDDYGNLLGAKYGLVGLDGKELLPVKYAMVGNFNERGIAMINDTGSLNKEGEFEGGKYGFINNAGTILIKPSYTYVGEFDGAGHAWVNVGGRLDDSGDCVGGKFGYINADAVELVAPKYDFIGPLDENGICWVNKGGKVFVADKQVNAQLKAFAEKEKDPELIRAQREALEFPITGGKVDIIGKKVTGGKYGFVNTAGKEIVALKYDKTANRFVEGFAWVYAKKYGYVDQNGREICKLTYDGAEDFHNGLAKVMRLNKKDERYGFLNTSGREVTPVKYAEVGLLDDGFAYVKSASEYDKRTKKRLDAKYGFIDESGKEITPLKYDDVTKKANGLALCRIGRDLGFINARGEEITPFVLTGADAFESEVTWVKLKQEDAALVKRGAPLQDAGKKFEQKEQQPDRLVLIDKSGIARTEAVYRWAQAPSEGLIAAVTTEGKAGWLDLEGNEAIPFVYSGANSFYDGLAAVQQEAKWGFIDKNGEIVIPCQFEDVGTRFINEVNGVKQTLEGYTFWGGIDRSGQLVIPIAAKSLEDIRELVEYVYVPNGRRPVSTNELLIYNKYKSSRDFRALLTMKLDEAIWAY